MTDTPVEKFQNKYRIGTKRASWHDYNGGEYFITICTKERKHYFVEIVAGEMQLSAVGKYTDECVQKISEHNPYAQIPQYVIMPDHIHLIVIISGDDCRNAPWRVSTNEPSPCISADGKNKTMVNRHHAFPPMGKTKPCKKWPMTKGVYQSRWAVSNNPLWGSGAPRQGSFINRDGRFQTIRCGVVARRDTTQHH